MNRMLLTAGLVALLGAFGTAQAAGNVQAGMGKAAVCKGCHGAKGEGKGSAPALSDKSEQVLVQAMKDFKSGKKPSPVMKSFASKLSDQDMENLAAYFVSLKGK